MYENAKPVLQALSGQVGGRLPLWLMRQAGRYLPEYRQLRKQADSFIDFCLKPSLAAEATLQPLKRFDLDAAILFADILLIPHALGQRMAFIEGEGPRLEAIDGGAAIQQLEYREEKIAPVFETVRRVKPALGAAQTLIGFCGGPWTVACYMIEGRSKIDFTLAKMAATAHPQLLDALLEKIEDASLQYLLGQIEAGAQVVQIFESHAGQLVGATFDEFVIQPTQRLVAGLRAKHKGFPIIGFPRGASLPDYKRFALETGVTCCGIDQATPLFFAKEELQPHVCVQGNLSPNLLLEGGAPMINQTRAILSQLGDRLIFNLGHGLIKETPLENVAALVDFVHGWKKQP
ncbi:MAG TPA: uroporphyrinogen decarboxylase [Rhodospirillaceae bacterium]|nr:uroporphyrinogen decarboxylase [Rhodospirillaceae bacterium]